jgi:translocation and assembly module TamB
MNRYTIYKLLLLAGFCFMLGFTYNYHLPKFESWLLVEAERVSQEHTPLRIYAQRLKFHLLPLGIVLEDVRVLAQPPLDKYLAPAMLKQVGARLSLWPLLRGEVRLSQVYIRDSEINVFLKSDLFTPHKGSAPTHFDFEKLYSLPIDEILLENVQIQGRLDPQNVVFRITDLNFLIENRYQSIFVEVNAPRVLVKPSGPVNPLNVQLELRSLIEAQELQVSAFKLKADDSFVVASGRFNGDFSLGRIDNGAFDARTKLQLKDINVWENVFFLNPKIPTLKGRAELDLGVEVNKGKGSKFEAEIATHDVEIDKFIVGNLQGHLTSDLKTITSKSLVAENSAGKAEIEKLVVTLEPKPVFSANVKVHEIEVHQLLENLAVHHVPIKVPVKGEASCEGSLGDAPELNCHGKATTSMAHVDSGRPSFSTIVEVPDARIKGEVKVTGKQVEYKAEIEAGKLSSGRSDGVINYDTGFKINYSGDRVAMSDVKNIVNLKTEGELKVSGNTQGTSDWATIDMNVEGKDLWLEDYPLGQATTKLNYKAGHLLFRDINGQFDVSRYTGLVELNLIKDRIRITGQIPFMDLKDVQSLFKRKITLPILMSGTGTGRVDAEGPYRFQDMSYSFHSSFYRGQIAKESFDDLTFNVTSTDGLVKSEKILLKKANGSVEMKGQITPKGEIDTVAVGRQIRLEQSENVLQMGLDLQGLADFTVLIRGQLPRPRIEVNGRLSKVVLADQAAEDSVFKLNFLSDRMEGSGQFLGSTLISDFIFPYENNAPFLFKLKTKKWDFTNLFSLVSKSARQIDFNTSVSMDIALQAPQGGFWASTGKAHITEFSLRKGGKSMTAEKPMTLNFKQGVVNSENFVISSGDSYLKLDVAGLARNTLNASLNGKLDLSLLGLFTPFIADLRGNMAVSMDLKGTADKPLLSGSAYVDRGYVKLQEFPHPFSNIRADVLFNDNQILLNTVNADLANGKVTGEGKVTFAGASSRPIDIKGSFSGVKLNFPVGYKSTGSGTVAIHRDRFPYSMDINYDVFGGELVAEFGEDNSGSNTVKASNYLPRFLDQEVFHPFNFIIDVNLKNPILVNNAYLRSSVSGHVKATGTPDRLVLNGSFTPLPGGKLFFHDAPFDIQSAFIEYNNAPPNDPKIYLTATTRATDTTIDDQGRTTLTQYDVSLLAQGHGQDPQIDLSSQPPLGKREIVSLLALGTTGGTGTSDDRKGTSMQATSGSAALGAAILQKAGGKQMKDSLGVDVKVSSQQNTGVTDNASSPKVTLSKQWTPKFGASASSTIESSPNNSVKLEYKMNQGTSVIGTWDGRENLHDTIDDTTKNVLGLDLQYKLQFK